jgi:hypothetical protein
MSHSNHQKVELIVTVADDSKATLKQIASELQRLGMEINTEPLESLKMISGLANTSNINQLKSVDGVIAVEEAGTMQIAPPDSDIQ